MAKKQSKGKKKAKKKILKKAKPKAAKKALRKAAKRPAKKAVKMKQAAVRPAKPLKKPVQKAAVLPPKNKVGEVTHFYSHISVAVVKLGGTLKEGDKISIEGATTNFIQAANSMQINHQTVLEARPGDEIGLKVKDKVREGDAVYKL